MFILKIASYVISRCNRQKYIVTPARI